MSKFQVTTTFKNGKIYVSDTLSNTLYSVSEIVFEKTSDLNLSRESIDRYIFPVTENYDIIISLIDKIISSFKRSAYSSVESASNDILIYLDKFIVSSRILRKKLIHMGFIKLFKIGRANVITSLSTKTDEVLDELNQLNKLIQEEYHYLSETIFFEHIINGQTILDNYIEKFESLKNTTLLWIEKFF